MHITAFTMADITTKATFGRYDFRNAQGRLTLHSLFFMLAIAAIGGLFAVWASLRGDTLTGGNGFLMLDANGYPLFGQSIAAFFQSANMAFLDYVVLFALGLLALLAVAYLAKIWWKFMVTYVARFHSWNLSGWWLLPLIPVLVVADFFVGVGSTVLNFLTLFRRGSETPDKFNATEGNTYSRGSRILAWVPLGIFWIQFAMVIFAAFMYGSVWWILLAVGVTGAVAWLARHEALKPSV